MATREELYTALRNADAAGDNEGAAKLAAYIQSMPAETASAAASAAPAAAAAPPLTRNESFLLQNPVTHAAAGAAENALQFGTGQVAQVAGGLAGIVTGNPDNVEKVSQAMTYHPRTPAGQAMSKLGEIVPGLIDQGTDAAGQKVSDLAEGSSFEPVRKAAPYLGAATKTAIQAVPMLLLRGAGKGKVAAAPVAEEAAAATPEARAQAYVSDRTSLDWNSLADAVKARLTDVARDAKNLEQLDPKAVERIARAQSQNVPITRGQATRDLGQLTAEENIKRTAAGEPVRAVSAQQDTALHQQLQSVREEVAPGSKVLASEDVGVPLQSAARRKLQVMKAQSQREYRAADTAGETAAPVSVEPLQSWLKEPVNQVNTPTLQKLLTAYAKDGKTVTIQELENIRQDLGKEAAANTKEGHYAGSAIKVIDGILDASGGDLYKQARGSWRAWNDEFGRQAAVRDLVSDKPNVYDRKVALENTLDHVVRGSAEQLKDIQNTLLKGGTEATRLRGAKAWRDVQAGVIQYLAEKAAGKRAITGEQGQQQFNATFIDAVADLEKGGKLDTLFGKEGAQKIRALADTTRDVRTTPADRIAGPNTASRLMAIAETFLKLPLAKEITQHFKEQATVRGALSDPLQEASAKSIKAAESQARQQSLADLARRNSGLPLTAQPTQKKLSEFAHQ